MPGENRTAPARSGSDGRRARLRPIGVIRSTFKTRGEAPKQGSEGAPDAWLEVMPFAAQGLDGLAAGDDIIVVTWLHQARRDVLKVHPRSDRRRPVTGVFATRSPDRPNPVGLHRVNVRRIAKNRLRIGPIEAIDGTPVIDIKPVLSGLQDSQVMGGRLVSPGPVCIVCTKTQSSVWRRRFLRCAAHCQTEHGVGGCLIASRLMSETRHALPLFHRGDAAEFVQPVHDNPTWAKS